MGLVGYVMEMAGEEGWDDWVLSCAGVRWRNVVCRLI